MDREFANLRLKIEILRPQLPADDPIFGLVESGDLNHLTYEYQRAVDSIVRNSHLADLRLMQMMGISTTLTGQETLDELQEIHQAQMEQARPLIADLVRFIQTTNT